LGENSISGLESSSK